jgi:hypothetical protein
MHYNFFSVHETLKITPAMQVGVTDHIWSIYDGLEHWFITHAIGYDAHLKAVFQALMKDRPDLLTLLSGQI